MCYELSNFPISDEHATTGITVIFKQLAIMQNIAIMMLYWWFHLGKYQKFWKKYVTKEKTNKFMPLVLSLGTLEIIVGPSSMQWRPPRNMFKSNDKIKRHVHVPVFLIM